MDRRGGGGDEQEKEEGVSRRREGGGGGVGWTNLIITRLSASSQSGPLFCNIGVDKSIDYIE